MRPLSRAHGYIIILQKAKERNDKIDKNVGKAFTLA